MKIIKKIKITFDLDTYLGIEGAEVWNNRHGEGRLLDFQLHGRQPLAVAFYRPEIEKDVILTFNKDGHYDPNGLDDKELDLYLKVDPREVFEVGDIIRYDDSKVGEVFFECGSVTDTMVKAKRLWAEKADAYFVDTEIEPRDWSRMATDKEIDYFNKRWDDNERRQRVNGYIVTWEPNDIITMGEKGERVIFQFLKDLGNGKVLAGVTYHEEDGTTAPGGEVNVTANARPATHYEELSQLVHLLGRTINNEPELITGDDSRELVNVVTDYTYALDTLDRYDYQQLTIEHTTIEESFRATYDSAMETIETLKEKFGGSTLFGKEKDGSFRSSIGQIYQTFDGDELYPSVEEKAAMLLYLVVKNHSFVDGNKRIAATLFLWFMQNNGILYNPDGTKRISDGTLVALTLMIAESRADEKDMILKVIVNLINKSN